jgi:purine-binding chemotaxis protein CheW
MSMDDKSPALAETENAIVLRRLNAQILHERAKSIARPPLDRESASGHIEVVEFLLADEHYGIESVWVREVFSLRDLTPVPCTPPFVVGVLNVRGQIRTVIDIRRFFDLPLKGLTDLNKVLFLETEQMQTGILADEILGVRSIAPGALQAPLPTMTGARAEYLRGITPDRVAVLDAVKVLSDKRLLVQEEVEG